MHRRMQTLALVAVMLAASTLTVFAQPAAATVTCGTHGNYFKGYYHNTHTHSDTFEGASAYMVNRFAGTCDTDTSSPSPSGQYIGSNFSTAWVMIADYSYTGWSQVGTISGYDLNQYFWAEVRLPSSQYDRFYLTSTGAITYGNRHAYTEKYVSYCPAPTNHACEESFVDNVRITDTNFNPFGNFTTGGYYPPRWSPQYSGEKSYQESEIPGIVSAPTNFTALGVQQYSNNQSVPEPCTLSDAIPVATSAGKTSSQCTNFNIWATN